MMLVTVVLLFILIQPVKGMRRLIKLIQMGWMGSGIGSPGFLSGR